ncbi:hypothetical protein IW262DRAFT_1448880 [Armillaria fumosa]|nr:hypothetical protein IW262DRAFT_1448880 [Armillaria fumosa]
MGGTSKSQDVLFRGMNMIFASDFAQLPPIMGEDWSLYGHKMVYMANNLLGQKRAIDRSLWHQVTTIIILRQNMHQRSQSKDDAKLRTALENMRYKDCMDNDITFLKSRVSNARLNGPTIKDDVFHNVSITTAWNVHNDKINRLGVQRFVRETSQELVNFYSNNSLKHAKNAVDNDELVKFCLNSKLIQLKSITDELQSLLWNQPPSAMSQHLPSKLRLCVRLPVMIRYNSTTELCITKGQEGTIYMWQATISDRGQQMLDTLFVRLTKPLMDMQLDGLLLNVVLLTPSATMVEITREQVEVLPNFLMTDYASQGKTRSYNVVDITKCRLHQAFVTTAGMLILQKWTEDISAKVQGHASSALRQEF